MGTRIGFLHSQEGANALDLTLESAVCEALAFGGEPTRSHPLSILLLLEDKKDRGVDAGETAGLTERKRYRSMRRHVASHFHSAGRPRSCPQALVSGV